MTSMARRRTATFRGIVSIFLWATSVPVSRIVLERFGLYLGTAMTLCSAGLFLLLFTSVKSKGCAWFRRLSRAHLWICGPLFVGYMLLLYAAVGLSSSRDQAIVAGLANYLWPGLILVFSVVILRARVRWIGLVAGLTVCIAGVALAAVGDLGSPAALSRALSRSILPLGLGITAAICWGLYSVLARIYSQTESSGAIGLFLLVTGTVALLLGAGRLGEICGDWTAIATMIYMALLPNSLAYWLWDEAMRDGSVQTLGALANGIPVLSAAIGTVVLGLNLRAELLLGGGLVTIGAAISRLSFHSRTRNSGS